MSWLVWISAESESESGWIGVEGELVQRWVDAQVFDRPRDALCAGDTITLGRDRAIVYPVQLDHVVERLGCKSGSVGALFADLIRPEQGQPVHHRWWWWLIHNLIAHPLLVIGLGVATRLHDWTARKMGEHP
jgi:hypothetical protein